MKFDMGSATLTQLSQKTQGSGDELGALIKQLVVAAQPLEGRFNGAGKAAFDNFKAHADEITGELSSALHSILGGQRGMDRSFITGESVMAEEAAKTMGAAPFDAARFRGA
ncbi:MAG: hypothetical protein JWN52_4480 [Actinomycetia bacterium]|nr:hypothetical protein [Actinomycetes bacterium]